MSYWKPLPVFSNGQLRRRKKCCIISQRHNVEGLQRTECLNPRQKLLKISYIRVIISRGNVSFEDFHLILPDTELFCIRYNGFRECGVWCGYENSTQKEKSSETEVMVMRGTNTQMQIVDTQNKFKI